MTTLFDYSKREDLQPLWTFKERKSKVAAVDPAPPGSCEFVGEPIWQGFTGRSCTLGGSCFLFLKFKDYVSCPSRVEKLKEQT